MVGLVKVRRRGDEEENPININNQKYTKKYMRIASFYVLYMNLKKELVNA